MHKQHGQLDFHFLMVFKKHSEELESILFYGIKAQIYGDKKNVVSVSYITIFRFLAYNSFHILKSYGIVSLTLKTSFSIAGDRPCRYL